MIDYFELLSKEEEFRLSEQTALINSLLSGNASKGKLSILRRAGFAMTGLEVVNKRNCLGGRIIFDLKGKLTENNKGSSSSKASKSEPVSNTFKPSCFKPGDLVKLIISGRLLDCTGTIEKCPRDSDVSISINSTFADSDEIDVINSSRIGIVKIVDEVRMFGKMKGNLEKLLNERNEFEGNELQKYVQKFIMNISSNTEIDKVKANDNDKDTRRVQSKGPLNDEQELAVTKGLEMIFDENEGNNLVLIHGPPGTGKTSVLVELIIRIRNLNLGKKLKILICGPSNLSVDNILERIQEDQKFDQKILRIGHSSRVLESCQGNTLDYWCEHSEQGLLLKDVQGEIDKILKFHLPRAKSGEERKNFFNELKDLKRERKERKRNLEINLINEAEIVICTLGTACGGKLLQLKKKFDIAIVDEAGQALLPEILIAPILSKKLILAGDHFQLPPTVMNPEIKSKLQISLFEHLIQSGDHENSNSNSNSLMLKEQYRMNEIIMKWSNSKFYNNQLRAAKSVCNWKLNEDEDVLIFYDTCGFDLWESIDDSSGPKQLLIEESSKFNEGEAKISIDHYNNLINSGIPSSSIAIISPYSAQVNLIRELLAHDQQPGPEINSIDSFQGREKDVVILSLVRSNPDGIVGFLGELRRLNVAMTRAKKQLVIIGDSETLSRDSELKGLIDFLNENAVIKFP